MRHQTFLQAFAALAIAALTAQVQATTVTYNGFASAVGLTTAGSASFVNTGGPDGTVLRLTPSAFNQAGAAYSTTAVTLGTNATFSTTFQFRLTDPAGIDPADGFTFVLAAASTGLGSTGGGIGIQNLPNSVAIEFDTYNNGPGDGNSSNHVGLDVNGNVNSTNLSNVYNVQTCTFSGPNSYLANGCMSNSHLWTATIAYNGTTLSATLIDPAIGSIFTALSNVAIDIGSILGTNNAFVGFTSATGSGYANHDIVNWTFANDLSVINPGNNVPEPGSLALLGLALGVLGMARRRSN